MCLPNIPAGWCFNSADFSMMAAGQQSPGRVLLVRDPADRAKWHAMNEEQRDRLDLYVCGHGMHLQEAAENAVTLAQATAPLEDPA